MSVPSDDAPITPYSFRLLIISIMPAVVVPKINKTERAQQVFSCLNKRLHALAFHH